MNSASGGREPAFHDTDAAIRLGISQREQLETRWGLILVVFMRLLAALWILQGLLEWSRFMVPSDAIFAHMRISQTAAMMFFSVVDLLAAVGLWLATPWGGVLWLFASLAQVFVAVTIPNTFSVAWIAVDVVLIGLYFVLTWQAGHVSSMRGK